MGSSKSYREFILDQLSLLDGITDKPMMGEYILYLKGTIIGGIYDDRLLLKKCSENEAFSMEEAIPYPNAKPMWLVGEVDDRERLKKVIEETAKGLARE